MTTTYSNKTIILADLWLNYRDDENFKEFVQYNDLGLPLAYAIANSIVESTPMAEQFIEESFDVLLSALGIEDTGFELFDELIEE
jgi:hypothetical protein